MSSDPGDGPVTDGSEPVVVVAPSLGRAVARSSVWSLGGQAASLGVAFLATPFTVRFLGAESYGLVALVSSLIGYVTVLDLGMGTASTRMGSEAYARGDERGEAEAVWTATAVTLVPTLLAALVMWLAAPEIVNRFLHLAPSLQGSAVLALRLGAVAVLARIVSAVINTPELVRLRWDLYVLITNGSGVAQVIAVAVVASAGGGAGAALGVMAGAALVALVLHAAVGARLAPAMRRPAVRAALVRPLLGFGGSLMLANALGLVLGSGERFILAATHPIRAVAHYAIAANLAQIMAVVPIAICQPLLPAFARLQAKGDTEQSARLYRRALTAIIAGVLPIAVSLAVVGGPFLDVWAGKEYGASSVTPLRILLVGVVINACAFVPYNFLLGMGETKAIVRCHLYELPLYAIYAVPTISRFGASGAAAVWTFRLALVTGYMFFVAARKGPDSTAPFGEVLSRVGPVASVLVLPLLADLLTAGPVIPILVLLATLPVYAVLAWRRALEQSDRTQILRLLRLGDRR